MCFPVDIKISLEEKDNCFSYKETIDKEETIWDETLISHQLSSWG